MFVWRLTNCVFVFFFHKLNPDPNTEANEGATEDKVIDQVEEQSPIVIEQVTDEPSNIFEDESLYLTLTQPAQQRKRPKTRQKRRRQRRSHVKQSE